METVGGENIFRGKRIDSKQYSGPLWPFLKQKMESFGSRTALVSRYVRYVTDPLARRVWGREQIDPYKQQELTYTEVVKRAEALARGLMKLGLRQGTSLCIFAPNSVENALLILATHAIGATVHAPNPASLPGELRRQLGLSDAPLIVTVPELLAPVKEAVAGTDVRIIVIGPRDGNLNYLDLLALGSGDVTLPPPPADPSKVIASLLFSSGTTGLPKGVQITQRNIMAFIFIYEAFDGRQIDEKDTVVLFLPFFHVYGQVVTLLTGLAHGCRHVIMSKFEMVPFLTFCQRYKATVLFLVPPVIIGMVNFPGLSKYDLSTVRMVTTGAAPLGQEVEQQFVKKLNLPCLLNGYGMTENMVATVQSFRYHKSGTVGHLLPNMDYKIVDPETGRSLGVDQTGELYMRGPMTMMGYHKNPEATRQTIDRDGWIHTGDMARIDADGYLYIVDRLKELIKYKGEQVAPAVLEDLLMAHPELSDVCVIGLPDPVAGELPRAYVVRTPGSKVTEQEVKDFVAKQVPSYMQLRGGVEFRETIPKSPSGKILRRLLRDELKQQQKSRL
ncbi:hypothetical protein BaRGS_00005799 [Batillaria attramentaria]|uniref:Uncharacterized protein n=1 Tax=Batillaria attramentaria TaxID=370345 RepID=A0ABD0LTA4_9CAEN